MKSNKYIKWIILLIDVIAIALIWIAYNTWENKREKQIDKDNVEETKIEEVRFKNFIFKIPENTEYLPIEEHKFKLKNDYYEAIVEPFLHNDTNMLKYPELYYDELTGNGVNLSKPEKIKEGIVDLVKYTKSTNENETTLYYFSYNENFDYEVEMLTGDEKLGSVMNILINAEYDYTSNKKYDYKMWDYEEEITKMHS